MGIHDVRKRPRKRSRTKGVLPWLIARTAAAELLTGDARWPSADALRAWLAAVPLAVIRRSIRNRALSPSARPRLPRPAWKSLAQAQRRERREDGFNAARVWYERPGALGRP